MIVMKFGGTSVKTAAAMTNVISIVSRYAHEHVIVVASACGGITNMLVSLCDAAAEGNRQKVHEILADIAAHHQNVCLELLGGSDHEEFTWKSVQALLQELERFVEGVILLGECTARARAMMLSFGERLSTEILTSGFLHRGMTTEKIDAVQFMRTDSVDPLNAIHLQSAVNTKVKENLLPAFERLQVVVTQGFIGCSEENYVCVLGRGGSDLSAAIIGAATGAREIQIWTDVSGVFTADPRIEPHAQTIAEMSFEEAGELAYFGAKVLHQDTIRPAIETAIPVRVLNTFRPEDAGTLLTPERKRDVSEIRGVTAKTGVSLLLCELAPESIKSDVLAEVFVRTRSTEIFVFQHQERFFAMAIPTDSALTLQRDLHGLKMKCSIEEIALICACGTIGASEVSSFSEKIASFAPKFIQQTARGNALIAGVIPEKAVAAVRAIHELIV